MQRSRTPALGTDTSGINESNSVHTGEASDSGLDYSNTPLLHCSTTPLAATLGRPIRGPGQFKIPNLTAGQAPGR